MTSEYKKMIAGENYSPQDPELRALATRSREFQYRFNQERDIEKRSAIAKEWFGSAGENLWLHLIRSVIMELTFTWARIFIPTGI